MLTSAARGIRGATVVLSNTAEDIEKATVELAFAIFTLTKDLNAAFPAKFARLCCGFDTVPMMCYQELDVPNSIQKCLRVLIVVNTDLGQNEINHVYLKEAKALRVDLEKDTH